MIEKVKKQVYELLNKDNSGHGMEHINRVLNLALKFAETENVNNDVVALIALLHDVDDYKIFGIENSSQLSNAKYILEKISVEDDIQKQVLNGIKTIGYSKRLMGIKPVTLEAKLVSDADMCDTLGATGIIRSYQYHLAHGNMFFDKDEYPISNISANEYMNRKGDTVVVHMFEKLLKLKNLMLTDSGEKEAIKRHSLMVEFLYHFFEEENVPEWTEYLNNYLKENR